MDHDYWREQLGDFGLSVMRSLLNLLTIAVAAESRDSKVALLLSGGIDSLSVGLACRDAGKDVRAYTYELAGFASDDRRKAQALAEHFGWPLTVIEVPTRDLADDFRRLAIEERCRKKVHFETMLPLLYVLPAIVENEIWSGWNADDSFGNTREAQFHFHRLAGAGLAAEALQEQFDAYRREVYSKFDDPWLYTWRYAQRLAEKNGKRLLDPYVDKTVRNAFMPFSHRELSPPRKPVVREALASELATLPPATIAVGVKLQKGGQVDKVFEALLSDPNVNCFSPAYSSVSALCHRWASEVAKGKIPCACTAPQATSARSMLSGKFNPYLMADVGREAARKRFSVVSTFAGGGGSSVGYRLAGGVVLAANEFVPEAARTYRVNFPDCIVDTRDIRELIVDGEVEKLLKRVGLSVGELDLLDGSPPCSEFSTAGRGIGDQEIMRPYSDVKQNHIATLAFDYADVVLQALPKVMLMENVPAMATRGRHILDGVMEELSDKYILGFKKLTASDFGVPQKRNRLFVLGVRRDVAKIVGIDNEVSIRSIFPKASTQPVTVREALAGLAQSANDTEPWIASSVSTRLASDIRRLPKSPPKPTRLSDVYPGYVKKFSLTRCAWDRPAPTLVVTGQKNNGMTGAVHPEKDRKFTIPELKRLMGLPDDFVLTGTLSQRAERICRMVPPLLTKAIAQRIYEVVIQPYNAQKEGTKR